MKARAKSSNTPCPIWVQGEYITEPPIRPVDGAKRPVGHYIDKGGYPGANVYEVSIETLCRDTGAVDRRKRGIKVIGNMIDFPDFVEGIRHCVDTESEIPYLPALDVMETPYPFLKMTCLKCGHVTLGCRYTAKHKDCGGYFTADFATKIYRKGEQKEKAFA